MDNVVNFDHHRRTTSPQENAVCPCGSEWFSLRRRPSDPADIDHGAVTLRVDGTVTGYVGQPYCVECGRAW